MMDIFLNLFATYTIFLTFSTVLISLVYSAHWLGKIEFAFGMAWAVWAGWVVGLLLLLVWMP